jgi:hypothetical protein
MPDSITITIAAKTMEGLGAVDPEVTVEISEVTPISQPVARRPILNFDTTATLEIAAPDGFPTWQVNVTFSRFDVVSKSPSSPSFFLSPRPNTSKLHEMKVVRLPNKWTPQFTPLNALPSPRFDPLKRVLAVSKSVDLKDGPPAGDLDQSYDTLANSAQILAKTALLNLVAVLSDEQDPESSPSVSWFSYVRKIVRIDQERFIAEVDPTLFEDVQTILRKLDSTYKAQGYFTESPALHTANIPPQYDIEHNLMMPMITVKKKYEQGNVQLTLAALSTPSGAVHLLDCDMDEHANIALHGLDLVKHWITGGTKPIAMHEYIVEDSAQQANGIAAIDLGYQLV